jgi:hypothetical protein
MGREGPDAAVVAKDRLGLARRGQRRRALEKRHGLHERVERAPADPVSQLGLAAALPSDASVIDPVVLVIELGENRQRFLVQFNPSGRKTVG